MSEPPHALPDHDAAAAGQGGGRWSGLASLLTAITELINRPLRPRDRLGNRSSHDDDDDDFYDIFLFGPHS